MNELYWLEKAKKMGIALSVLMYIIGVVVFSLMALQVAMLGMSLEPLPKIIAMGILFGSPFFVLITIYLLACLRLPKGRNGSFIFSIVFTILFIILFALTIFFWWPILYGLFLSVLILLSGLFLYYLKKSRSARLQERQLVQ